MNGYNKIVWYPLTLDVFLQFLYMMSMISCCVYNTFVKSMNVNWCIFIVCSIFLPLWFLQWKIEFATEETSMIYKEKIPIELS